MISPAVEQQPVLPCGAPFCLYVYQLADTNQTNLNDTIKYISSFYVGGTGKLKNGEQNIDFSKSTLIEYAIR